MPKTTPDNDPASILRDQAAALAADRQLGAFFDRIAEAETRKNEASDEIKRLWLQIRRDGHDVADARRRYVRHVCAG